MRALLPWVVAVALACGAADAGAVQARGEVAFQQGVKAYRAGRFDRALQQFELARRQGLQNPNLDLNLGLTYYRLERYHESAEYFEVLRRDLRYTAIAEYHLGLIAAQLGEREMALHHFYAIEGMGASGELQRMAGLALGHIAGETAPAEAELPDTRLYLRAGLGYDTNPELVNDVSEPQGLDFGSRFAGLSADAEVPVGVNWVGPASLLAGVDLRQHLDEHGYNQQGVDLGLRQHWYGRQWRLGVAGEGGAFWLDGEPFVNSVGLGLDARREVGAYVTVLRYGPERIAGGGEYEYLNGWRHRLEAQLGRPIGAYRARGKYEFEHNEREDDTDGAEFTSHSPQRHGLGLSLGLPAWRQLTSEVRAGYRRSSYADPNRFFVGTTLVEESRADSLMLAGLRGRVQQRPTWNWLLEYQYARNDSNLDGYDYARHLALLGIEWLR